MDQEEDVNDIEPTPSGSGVNINEETGENEQGTYEHNRQQYRIHGELFASDEESDASNSSVRTNKSRNQCRTQDLEHAINNQSFSEHLNSVANFNECSEQFSSFFPVNELLDHRNDENYLLEDYEEAIRKLDEVCLISGSSKYSSSIENESEKTGISPDIVDISDGNSSKEDKKSAFRIKKSNIFYTENSDPIVTLESSGSGKISPMSPQHILMSRYPNFATPPINTVTSPLESASFSNVCFSSPISESLSSNFINSGSTESSQDPSNSDILYSPKTENAANSKTLRGFFTRSCEIPYSSKPYQFCEKYCQKSCICSTFNSSIRNRDENSKTLREHFSSTWELQRTSNHSIEECRQLNSHPSCSKNFSTESASALSDLPSTSMTTPQHTSEKSCFKRATKSARKLIFDDSDTSSNDAKQIFPLIKEPRKRKKTKRFNLSNSSENRTTFPKIDNDEHVSENESSSPSSSKNSKRKSIKLNETASESNTLLSLNIMPSNETHHSTRKRLISNGKSLSDAEKSDRENKRNKKLKQSPSSD